MSGGRFDVIPLKLFQRHCICFTCLETEASLQYWRTQAVELNLDAQNIHRGLEEFVPSASPVQLHSRDK